MSDDPTPRELLLRIEQVAKELSTLTATVGSLVNTLSTTYVPKGEYLSDRRGDERRFQELEDDNEKQAGFRRQVAAGFTVGLLLIVAGIIVGLAQGGAGMAAGG